jgi:hypothetical protein
MKLYGHHKSELNMSEHFLWSNKAFEILANLGGHTLAQDWMDGFVGREGSRAITLFTEA